jgi:hypothetical protein
MTYAVTLPEQLYRQVEKQAGQLHRSVDEWVEETLKREIYPSIAVEEDLPPWLKAELEAMAHLSDAVLWAVARSTMPRLEREELATLNEFGQEGVLTPEQEERQRVLLNAYNETILRRAHAALLLQARGYDMSNLQTVATA